jgi:NADH-quinone oxidoreductase subunit H
MFVEQIVVALISVFVFPGLIFTAALAFFTQYLIRKLSARFQRRMGPSYVGPFGVLQPFYDFLKLLRAKELVRTRFSMVRVAEVSLVIGIAFLIAALTFLPISIFRLQSELDVFVFFYMASVIPFIVKVIASIAMPGPYTSIGVSRMLSMATITEPAFFASIVIPVYLASKQGNVPFMSLSSYANVAKLWTNPVTAIVLLLNLIAYMVSLQAKAMYQPFNIPEAEQEIIAGFETEFSGPLLALAKLFHDIEVSVSLLLGVYVFLGGPLPFNHLSVEGVAIMIIKYLALVTIITFIKNIMGRYRIDQALLQVFKYSLVPAIIGAIVAMIV